MKRLYLLMVFGLCLASATGWAAQPIALHARTAGDLAALCGADPGSPGADAKINYCHGFAQGAVDDRLSLSTERKAFCFPNPAPPRSATMREFVAWVRGMPANQNMPVLDGLFKFLGERFPCR